jgi:hypothetical protein
MVRERNPATGDKVQVSDKGCPYFRPGRVLRDRVAIARQHLGQALRRVPYGLFWPRTCGAAASGRFAPLQRLAGGLGVPIKCRD